MAHRLLRLAPALTVAALLLLPVPASAANTCDPLVVDRADVLDDQAVVSAAKRVQDEAAEVRVVTYTTVPGGNLDAHMEAEKDRCGSWQGRGSTWKNNLIVLAVSVEDRKSGLYYADTFERELGRDWPRIQADDMNPRFARGDFTGGMEAALHEVAATLDATSAATDPTGPDAPAAVPPPVPGSGTPTPEPATPVEPTPAWLWATPLGVSALGGLGFGGVYTRRRLRTRAETRAAALTARDTMAEAFLTLDEAKAFTAARVEALPVVPDADLVDIRSRWEQLSGEVRETMTRYVTLAEQHTPETIGELNTTDSAAAGAALTATADDLTRLHRDVTDLDISLDTYETARDALPTRIAGVRADADRAAAVLATRAVEGFFTDRFAARLAAAEQTLRQAEDLAAQVRFGDADDLVTAAETDVTQVLKTADGLPGDHATLRSDLERLTAAADRGEVLVTQAAQVCDDLEAGWHTSCTDGVRDDVTAAQGHLRQLRADLTSLDRVSGMAVQDFSAGYTLTQAADRLVRLIEEHASAPASRRQQLRDLADDLPVRADRTHAALAQLRLQVSQAGDAVTYLTTPVDVDSLEALTGQVDTELALDRPRLLWAADTLADADRRTAAEVDRVAAVLADYTETERLISRARSKVSQAESAAARMHAGHRAKSLADDAARALRQAQAADTLESRRRYANQASSRAGDAESEARRAINAHNSRLSSATATGAAFGASSSSFGGGGSSSFGGGGGDFGGGSSSFGGGGDFGGGSSSF